MPRSASVERPVSLTAAQNVAVRLEGVRVSLAGAGGPVNVLQGIDLTAGRGECLGVVGPSGSGKTTMLMVMAGLERAQSGIVELVGTNLAGLDEDALARLRRQHVGIVFQSFHLISTMTALENVAVPLEFAGVGDAFARAEAALGRVGLAHRLTHYPGQLSGGEQQRVALARAFVGMPALLLADEPTGNLDAETGAVVIDLLFELARQHGTTLVLITHDASLAARCDRTVHVRDGRIVDDGFGHGAAL